MMTDAIASQKRRCFSAVERKRVADGEIQPRGMFFHVFMGAYSGTAMGLEAFYYAYPMPMSAIGNSQVMGIGRRFVFTGRIGKLILQGLYHHMPGGQGPFRFPANLWWMKYAPTIHPPDHT